MPEGMKFKPENIDAEREAAFAVVRQLERYGATVIVPEHALKNVGALQFQVTFPFQQEEATVNIFLSLKDWQTDSDVVITNMTTLPEAKQGEGLGSKALKSVLEWAAENQFEVRATQVSDPRSEKFWSDNGFAATEGPNPTGDFIYEKPKGDASSPD